MPLMPKRVKHRKVQRGRIKGEAHKGNSVVFGEYGLQTLENGHITAQQIEAARIACSHFLSREGKLWIRIFPDKPVTKKPLETRMGKGKGEPELWVAPVKAGRILFELAGVPEEIARETFNRMSHKLPVKVRMVERR